MLIWDRVPGPRRPGLKAGTLLLLIDRRSEGTAFPRKGATAPRSRPGALQRQLDAPVPYELGRGRRRAISKADARRGRGNSYLVDPASSHMLVSKIKPCMCKYKLFCTVKLRIARPQRRRCFIQMSALSTFDGRIEAYHGGNGRRRIRVRFRRGSLRNGYHIKGQRQP